MQSNLQSLDFRPPRNMELPERPVRPTLSREILEIRDQLHAKMVRVQGTEISLDLPYVVKHTLLRGEVSILYGPSNVGKSCLAIDLAHAVCTGQDWHGHQEPVSPRNGKAIPRRAKGCDVDCSRQPVEGGLGWHVSVIVD